MTMFSKLGTIGFLNSLQSENVKSLFFKYALFIHCNIAKHETWAENN